MTVAVRGTAPELLAPAGDSDALRAALAAGADAVYFGLDDGFNARARATNFSLDGLAETCDRIHRAGARAYLTLNTLVFEPELDTALLIVRRVAAAGVDALIAQDPAVALIARAVAPSLHVHASTQMTISSPEAAGFARQLGCRRVVVPRELSIAEIGQMAQGSDLELEVFIHGALCVSWSGQCLTSEAWGGRSANRGQCAQSCRMPYDAVVDGHRRDLGEVRYLLSPKDLAGINAVPELARIGVAGLKIEGRQKNAQYVMTALAGYRRAVDGLSGSGSATHVALRDMALSFSRGFSSGFLAGSDHQSLVEGRFPKHRGLFLGTVTQLRGREVFVACDTNADPRPGLGVVFEDGHPEAKDEPGGPVFRVAAGQGGWWLGFGVPGPDLARVRPGFRVWISSDPALAVQADRLVRAAEPDGRLPCVLQVSGLAGEHLRVDATIAAPGREPVTVTVASREPLQPAQTAGLDAKLLTEKLGAFGGTPLRLAVLGTEKLGPGLHLPVSALKSLRRDLVERLLSAFLARQRHAVDAAVLLEHLRLDASFRPGWQPLDVPQLLALCRSDAQLDAAIAAGLPEVELDWMEFVGLTRAVQKARNAGLRVTIATVRVQKPGEQGYDRRIARLQPDGVLVRHWGGLMHFAASRDPAAQCDGPRRPAVHGDFSLNVTNSLTAHHLFALGADTLTAAHDLDETQLHALLDRVPADRLTVTVHHHIATFHTEHCVYAHLLSQGKDFNDCGRACEAHAIALRDQRGLEHPVLVDVGCRNTVFNAQAQSAAPVVPRLLARGVRRFRVEFVGETDAQAAQVLAAYAGLLQGSRTAVEVLRQAGGHEQFGVTAGTMQTLLPLR